jgi:hypothetical protein
MTCSTPMRLLSGDLCLAKPSSVRYSILQDASWKQKTRELGDSLRATLCDCHKNILLKQPWGPRDPARRSSKREPTSANALIKPSKVGESIAVTRRANSTKWWKRYPPDQPQTSQNR